jgi:hypothetical protein
MDLLFYILISLSIITIVFTAIFLYITIKEYYIDGYEDCRLYYKLHRQVKAYEKPFSPYKIGWNDAIEDILGEKT